MINDWLRMVTFSVLAVTCLVSLLAYGAEKKPQPRDFVLEQQANAIQSQLNQLRDTTEELSKWIDDIKKRLFQVPPEQREMVDKIDKWTREERPKLQEMLDKVTAEKWDFAAQLNTITSSQLSHILNIAAVMIAVLGALSYYVISQKLRADLKEDIRALMATEHKNVNDSIQKEVNLSAARLYNQMAMVFSAQYHKLKPIEHMYRFALGEAIRLSEYSLEKVELLDREKYESVLFEAKNTLAYHLASRNEVRDFDKALELAKEVMFLSSDTTCYRYLLYICVQYQRIVGYSVILPYAQRGRRAKR